MSGISDRDNGDGAGQTNRETGKDFIVVGLGASAGGIKALKEFFERVAPDSGMAYVVILHLSPNHDSRLAEILQQVAPIPVTQVTGRVRVEPNNVYVIPPNKSLTMMDGHLALSDITRVEERRAPVDIFFRTLAESHDSRAVSVVLSGTGANGSMGMKRVKERGGVCFVQDHQEAEYSDMPRHSIATNLVDDVLPVAEIPARIVAYKEILGQGRFPAEAIDPPATDEGALRESEARLRAMFEQANVGIVQASFDGRLLVVNPGFCKVVGYTEDELLRMAIRLSDEQISETVAPFYGEQGAWYTVGWKMSVLIEKVLGRRALVAAMCDPRELIATYNRAAARHNRKSRKPLALWSPPLIEALRVVKEQQGGKLRQ